MLNNTFFQEFYASFPTEQSIIEGLYIPAIINAYHYVLSNTTKKLRDLKENDLRDELMIIFQDRHQFLGKYHKYVNTSSEQTKVIIRKRTDLEFFVTGLGSFIVECKQFTTYDLSYIKGENNKDGVYIENGVERFVKAIYVREEDKYAGMLGFYKNNTPTELIANLQKKIKKYFPKTEFPNFQPEQFSHHPHSFLSYHPREDETEITVYHCILPI
jgi:hypothetical protein